VAVVDSLCQCDDDEMVKQEFDTCYHCLRLLAQTTLF
jgi:hypothetical protein